MSPQLLEKLMNAAAPFYADAEPAHDWQHICRVLAYAKRIAQAEKADWEIVSAAVLLHDCIKLKPQSGQKDFSAEKSADKVGEILAGIKEFPTGKIEAVKTCVREHSFTVGISPNTLESKILQDADRLDSTGVISVMRVFAYCGAWGGKLFSWKDPFCENGRHFDNKAIGLDWVFARLMKVSATLHTQTAKEMAREWDAHLKSFLDMCRKEIAQFDTAEMLAWEAKGPRKA